MSIKEQFRFVEASPNFFAGSNLNRISERRTNNAFLSEALISSDSHFLLLSNGDPLAKVEPTALRWLPYCEVEEFINNPFVGKDQQEYPEGITLVFLGINEDKDKKTSYYWTLDVSPKGPLAETFGQLKTKLENEEYKFIPTRPKAFELSLEEAAILAQARALVDWNNRNQYCLLVVIRLSLQMPGISVLVHRYHHLK
ncbi:NADH pyrophosphatase [Basidiobolus ranarum]|uniref:NADH pyrophosphatase n=1 Tax=Basidiobolus ranarum TaxID=34480 RepID=A0ABR2WGD5_9FUNG